METEKFISLVFKRKCIWDQKDDQYHSRHVQRDAWKEVASEMKVPAEQLKKKWRGMRDIFRRELKRPNTTHPTQDFTSKWPYFKSLLFLKDTMALRDLKGSTPPLPAIELDTTDDSNNYSPIDAPSNTSQKTSPQSTSTRVFKSPLKKPRAKINPREEDVYNERLHQIEEKKLKYFKQNSQDSNVQFLMSLLPFLERVSQSRQLVVRTKLMQVLINEQNTTNIQHSTSSPREQEYLQLDWQSDGSHESTTYSDNSRFTGSTEYKQ